MRGLRRTAGFFAICLALTGPAFAQDTTISHGISAFGNLKYPADFTNFDYVNPDAPKGGTMSFRGFLASQTFDSLNDFILAGEPAQGLERIYDTLMVQAFDEPDSVYGLIAETLEYPQDRSWVIFNMRPEARFTDGEPITAEDVVWTIETLQADGEPRYQIRLKDVAKVEALDTHRVKMTFAEGVPTRDLAKDVGLIPILPSHYYQTVDFTKSTLEPPVGSGEFEVARVDSGRTVEYCRIDDYWGKDLAVNQGRDNFDCFRYEYFADNTAAFEALKSGTYLFHEEFTSATWATAYDFPALDRGWVLREEISDDRISGTQGFWMNLRRERFQDIRVREAIAVLFNFEWTNKTLFYGLYNRTDSFWENSPMEASGLPEGAELEILEPFRGQVPDSVFDEPAYVPPISSTEPVDRRVIRQSLRLFEEAGYSVGDDGMIRNPDGEIFSVEFLSASPSLERILLPFIENLKAAGIDATLNTIDRAQYEERRQEFDYDILIGRFSVPSVPSIELRQLYGSESADQPGTFNLSGLQNPVVDELIELVIASENQDEMEIRVRALDRVLRSLHIWSPNWSKGSHWIAYWDVFGKPAEKPPFERGENYWWWDEAKFQALQEAGALR